LFLTGSELGFTLKEEYILTESKIRVLRRMSGPKREEVTEGYTVQ
jgi:hypothetical protein